MTVFWEEGKVPLFSGIINDIGTVHKISSESGNEEKRKHFFIHMYILNFLRN